VSKQTDSEQVASAEVGTAAEMSGQITATSIGADGTVPRKRFPLHIAAIAVVLVASAVLLYGMRYLGLGPQASLGMEMMSIKLPETAGRTAQQKAVLDDLGSSRSSQQVTVDNVRANPFVLMGKALPRPTGMIGTVDDGSAAEKKRIDELRKAEADWLKNVAADLDSLQLNAVMGGSPARARINGELKVVGDRAGKYFTVKTILSRSVELEDDGHRSFVLEIKR
jgi:hypothetical protein